MGMFVVSCLVLACLSIACDCLAKNLMVCPGYRWKYNIVNMQTGDVRTREFTIEEGSGPNTPMGWHDVKEIKENGEERLITRIREFENRVFVDSEWVKKLGCELDEEDCLIYDFNVISSKEIRLLTFNQNYYISKGEWGRPEIVHELRRETGCWEIDGEKVMAIGTPWREPQFTAVPPLGVVTGSFFFAPSHYYKDWGDTGRETISLTSVFNAEGKQIYPENREIGPMLEEGKKWVYKKLPEIKPGPIWNESEDEWQLQGTELIGDETYQILWRTNTTKWEKELLDYWGTECRETVLESNNEKKKVAYVIEKEGKVWVHPIVPNDYWEICPWLAYDFNAELGSEMEIPCYSYTDMHISPESVFEYCAIPMHRLMATYDIMHEGQWRRIQEWRGYDSAVSLILEGVGRISNGNLFVSNDGRIPTGSYLYSDYVSLKETVSNNGTYLYPLIERTTNFVPQPEKRRNEWIEWSEGELGCNIAGELRIYDFQGVLLRCIDISEPGAVQLDPDIRSGIAVLTSGTTSQSLKFIR